MTHGEMRQRCELRQDHHQAIIHYILLSSIKLQSIRRQLQALQLHELAVACWQVLVRA